MRVEAFELSGHLGTGLGRLNKAASLLKESESHFGKTRSIHFMRLPSKFLQNYYEKKFP
jgi:hypothetical protein